MHTHTQKDRPTHAHTPRNRSMKTTFQTHTRPQEADRHRHKKQMKTTYKDRQRQKKQTNRERDAELYRPVSGWSVVERVVSHLHLEIEDDGTDRQGMANEVFTDDDQGHTSTANVLLGTRKDGTELGVTHKVHCYTQLPPECLYSIPISH